MSVIGAHDVDAIHATLVTAPSVRPSARDIKICVAAFDSQLTLRPVVHMFRPPSPPQ